MPTDIDLQRARSDPLASAFDAPQRRSNAITLDEILAGESGRGGGWESDSVVSASEEPPVIYDEDESDDEDLTTAGARPTGPEGRPGSAGSKNRLARRI